VGETGSEVTMMEKRDGTSGSLHQDRAGPNLNELIEFEIMCARAEAKSPKTIEGTTLAIRTLGRFLVEKGYATNVRGIGANEIREFLSYLRVLPRFSHHPYAKPSTNKCLSLDSIDSYYRALRAAWNRWVREGFLETSPFDKVRRPRLPVKVKPALSEEQLHRFIGGFHEYNPQGMRDRTLTELYVDTKSRLSEITRLTIDNLDLKSGTIKIVGKGNRERIVPFAHTVGKSLWKYIKYHRPEPALPQWDFVFLTHDGRPLTKNRVEAIVAKAAKRAVLEVHCTPHTLRRTGCLLHHRNGGDLISLQRMTGHSSLKSLAGYLNLDIGDVTQAQQRYSPIDNMVAHNPVKHTAKNKPPTITNSKRNDTTAPENEPAINADPGGDKDANQEMAKMVCFLAQEIARQASSKER